MITKGALRACIYDLQRKDIYPVPLSLTLLFDKNGVCHLEEWKTKVDQNSLETFEEYIGFLLDNEIAFGCQKDEINLFPNLPDDYLFPGTISNAVLDTYGNFEYFDQSFLQQLERLCCNHIQLRYFNAVSMEEVEKVLTLIKPSQIKSIEIILPEHPEEPEFYELINDIVDQNKKISSLVISNTSSLEVLNHGVYGIGFIIKINKKIDNSHHCGVIDKALFTVNVLMYTESLRHNTCLNRKIAIDTEGNIKNCPSMKESYGNISDTTLEEAISKPGFKQYWNITKDQITKCKDCEFRHICTDCRAYLDEPDDSYAAPLKCGYDPYTCEWEEWSANPLKQLAIMHYQIPVK